MPHELSTETKHALKTIRDYLAGENEAVQYSISFLADDVTTAPSMMIGGFQAGALPADDVVTDNEGEVFVMDPASSGTSTGTASMNVQTGEFSATWIAMGSAVVISGVVRCVEHIPTPEERYLFVIHEAGNGFFALTTTNI